MTNFPVDLQKSINNQQQAGVSSEQILRQLAYSNWSLADIEQAAQLLQSSQAAADASGKEGLLTKAFRIGFASIFLANGIIAWLKPADFHALLTGFPITHAIGHTELLIKLIGVNDLLLASLILSGRAKKFVWAWAGVYLASVSFVKLVSLF